MTNNITEAAYHASKAEDVYALAALTAKALEHAAPAEAKAIKTAYAALKAALAKA